MVHIGIIERLSKILKAQKNKQEPVAQEITLFDLQEGQIISLDLEDWVIEGKVTYRQQPGLVLYWIKSAMQRQALLLDKATPDQAVVLTLFPGRLDEADEVKTEYLLDGKRYFLDYHGECEVSVSGKVPVGPGELMFWQYETDQRQVYRIEWQKGRFFHYDGRWIDVFEIEVVA